MYPFGRKHHADISLRQNRSKSWHRKRSCTEKTKYKTQIEAAEAAIAYNLRIAIRTGDVQSYECRYCKNWHKGHDDRDYRKSKQVKMREDESSILLILNPTHKRMTAGKATWHLQTNSPRGLNIAA